VINKHNCKSFIKSWQPWGTDHSQMQGLKNISPQRLNILGGAPSFKLLLMAMSWLFQVPISPKSPKEITSFKYVCLVSCRWGLLNKCFKTSFFCLPYSQNFHIFSKSHIWQFYVCDDQCWVVLTFSVRTFKVFNPVLTMRIESFHIKRSPFWESIDQFSLKWIEFFENLKGYQLNLFW